VKKMTEVGKEYSKALFMLATEENSVLEYASELNSINSLVSENEGYCELLSSPALELSERLSAVDEALGSSFSENIVSFLKLLIENGHIKELPLFIEEYLELVRIASNRTTATVYSAVELDDKQKSALTNKLSAVYGKEVDAEYIIDKTLLGGIKISIDGSTIDGSIGKQLKKLRGVIGG